MTITLRSTKGSPLTHDELDANFSGLADGSLVTAVDASVTNFTPSGIGAGTPLTRTMQAKGREVFTSADISGAGARNTGLGEVRLSALTTGTDNTAIGYHALNALTTATLNTAVGSGALETNDIATGNTAVGLNALNRANGTGSNNTAVGNGAMVYCTTGNNNTAIGDSALIGSALTAQTASNNVAVGSSALNAVTTGANNTGIGTDALSTLSTAASCVAVGFNCLFTNNGNSNTGLGMQAGYDNTTGTNNTFIGYNTGRSVTTGGGNTVLGANVTLSAAAANNIVLAIGDGTAKAQFDSANWTFTGGAFIFSGGALDINAAASTTTAGHLSLGSTTQTTIGANGAASALTANPLGYLIHYIGSTKIVIPYYNG